MTVERPYKVRATSHKIFAAPTPMESSFKYSDRIYLLYSLCYINLMGMMTKVTSEV